jgi:hypothetical protein
VSDQQEEEILRRRAREQAEIERQTDTLVLRTLTSLVTASEELKAKLRRDTEGLLEGYRRTKRQLDNEIALATSERLRSRRAAEQERAEILREARVEAREIVEAAKREREQMLADARATELRLREVEEQLRSVFGRGIPGLERPTDAAAAPARPPAELPVASPPEPPAEPTAEAPPDAADAPEPFEPASPAALGQLAEALAAARPVDADEDREPPVAASDEAVVEGPAPDGPAEAAPQARHEDGPDAPSAPSAVASLLSGPPIPAPAPDRPARPLPFPARAYTQQPAPAPARRPVTLIFDGVPGYQQAMALERAVNDVLPDEEIDILQFERGQLVLGLQATDLGRLADQLVAGSPASLALDAVDGDRATFRCI